MEQPWLIMHAGALGDLVLTIQLALGLEAVHADGRLDVLSRADVGDLSDYRPAIARRSLDGFGTHALYSEGDQIISGPLTELLRGRRVLNALGDRASVVHRRIASAAAEVFSFDPRPRPGLNSHITVQWRRDLRGQDLVFPNEENAAVILSGAKNLAATLDDVVSRGDQILRFAQNDGSRSAQSDARTSTVVLIHPGSGGTDKCWPLDSYVDVARRLRADGREVQFILGPVERERWPRETRDAIAREFACECIDDAAGLVQRLGDAAVLIGNDAGPSHMAALLGVPTVTLFGPTDSRLWRPLGPNARVIQGDPAHDARCWGIAPQRVVSVASDILSCNA